MSCEKNERKFGVTAGVKNGISAAAGKAGNNVGRLRDNPPALGAGLGIGAGVTTALVARKIMQTRAARRNREALQTVFKLQQAAAVARQGLDESRLDMVQRARKQVINIVAKDVVPMQDRTWQKNILQFAAGIADAIDPEQLSRPGNMVWLEQSRRTLNAGRLIFATSKAPGWGVPLALGATAAVGGGLLAANIRRRQARPDKTAHRDALYAATLRGFYEQPHLTGSFNYKQGQALTARTSGMQAPLSELKKAAGPDTVARPLTKQGGEDDIYLLDGPRGHIHYRNSDEGNAVVLAAIPRRTQEKQLSEALGKGSRK